jgi:putative ABC transport system permease protein
MVISKRKADKYFPGENPVGKIVFLNDNEKMPIKIGGVMENFPSASHLQYDFLISLAGVAFWDGEQNTWMASNYDNYVLLRPGTDSKQFEKKVTSVVIRKYMVPEMTKSGNKYASNIEQNAFLELQPVTDIHLKSYDIHDSLPRRGDIRFVWLFGAVTCFILLIACINFINLSTAKSANRAKEVGLRKVVGSLRTTIIGQFLAEAIVYSMISFVLALLLSIVLLPYFNELAGKSLVIPWEKWWFLPSIAIASILVGILSGIYPAFYLSAFKPVNVLKGQLSKGSKSAPLRNALVVFQFTTSIILIIGTFVIYSQSKYLLSKQLGFDKDQVLIIQGTNTLRNQVSAFKNELKKLPQVKGVSISDYLPITGTMRNGNTFWNEGKMQEESGVAVQRWVVDEDYLATMGIKLVAGRNFSRTMSSDSQVLIINKTKAAQLGLKEPLGKRITNGYAMTVIGVVEDFNFESMRDKIGVLCMVLGNSNSMVSVKVKATTMLDALASVTAVWKGFLPHQQIRYSFLDESFANMYTDVQRMQAIFSSFSILAIIIACLGLFALSAFMAEQRSKEMGIRKVLGASVRQIGSLLSKDFLRLVLVSIIIASPIAWWGMNKWLQDFAYRISIGWQVFLITGVVVLMIALVTISFQAIKAAITNPVKSLRTE